MADSIQQKEPASAFTAKASALITGARFVNVSGNRTGGGILGGLSTDVANEIQVAMVGTSGGIAIGVSAWDAANGSNLKVWTGGIIGVEAGGTLTAGQAVMSDATGRAIAYNAGTYDPTGVAVTNLPAVHRLGVVLTGATVGQQAEILLNAA